MPRQASTIPAYPVKMLHDGILHRSVQHISSKPYIDGDTPSCMRLYYTCGPTTFVH